MNRKAVAMELKVACNKQLMKVEPLLLNVLELDVVSAVCVHIECLAAQDKLTSLGEDVKGRYKDVFSEIPHVDLLPNDVYARIKLKDAMKSITTRSYSTPRKYKEAWSILIQDHLDHGQIRPSNSEHASPAFLVPKTDKAVLPHWVNDYCILNSNTVLHAHPLPQVDNILAECGKGKIWSKLDMTNSFFQTLVHPDDVPLTVVTTPFGLHEWVVMPMGLKNSPPIHQRRMMNALHEHIGRICHVYLDDVIIWSDNLIDHEKHVNMVMEAL